jgi:hypothetical protein
VTFLTPSELYVLTGWRRKSDQIAYLQRKRIRHTINRSGHPVVTRAAIGAGPGDVVEITPALDLRAIRGAA